MEDREEDAWSGLEWTLPLRSRVMEWEWAWSETGGEGEFPFPMGPVLLVGEGRP